MSADTEELQFANLYGVYLKTLTEAESEALRLVEIESASYETIGIRLGRTRDQVKMLLFEARRKLMFGMSRTLSDLEEEPAA